MSAKKMLIAILALGWCGPAALAIGYDSDGDGVADAFDVCCATPPGTPVDDRGRPLGDLDRDCDVDLDDYALFQESFTGPLPVCVPCHASEDCSNYEYCAKLLGHCDGEGMCSPRPAHCPGIFDPVCSCDGVTYDNDCIAAGAGVSVDYPGPCGAACMHNDDCTVEDYCAKAVGDCDGAGECRERPEVCPTLWDPVCGCDGQTYPNDCVAAAAGVSVDYWGECEHPRCWSNNDCPPDHYCLFDGCAAETGTCWARPGACPDIWDPVCGCDEVTYANACFAAMAGMSVDYPGECPPPACLSNTDCPFNHYCAKPTGDCDGIGVCETRPEECPRLWDPVCGCDGVTYTNACFAAMAGTSVDYPGECSPNACADNTDCSMDEYCAKDVGDCDGLGRCAERPENCPYLWDPVCGCDGQTYANACLAAAAGISVDYPGECTVAYCWSNGDCPEGDYCFFAVCAAETGVCEPRPTACPAIWDPVCGCDGVTYSNACCAAMAGMSVDYPGECGCRDNDDCASEEYCAKAVGDCYGSGQCDPRPSSCPDIRDPVCGCNGFTYANACEAARAGQNVDHQGECQLTECWSNTDCLPEEYCFFHVCAAETGICLPRPAGCPDVWDPVCGCDGVTYSNACDAAAAGMSVDYPGECVEVCQANEDCAPEDYCLFEMCAAEMGTCQLRPPDCPDLWDPVCGCDGVTYTNRCEAARAGMSVDYPGGCVETCSSNDDCAANEYCLLENCAAPTGVCRPRPGGCPDIWDPVCGCDGQTYGNACLAAAAGVSVDYPGECVTTCWGNDDCGANEYCFLHVCAAETGVCLPRPDACPDLWDPVCGCDGTTYDNACEAARAGMSIAYPGRCQ